MHTLFIVLSLLLSSCSIQKVRFKPSDSDTVMYLTNGPLNGKELGVVTGDEGGAFWSDCHEMAAKSLEEMKRNSLICPIKKIFQN